MIFVKHGRFEKIHNDHKFFKISNFEVLANYKNKYEQKEKCF